jgi:hypothetical protein
MGKQTQKPYRSLKEVNLVFSAFDIIQPKRGEK